MPAKTSTTQARVAERLGIAHYVLDYESRFRTEVIDDFAETYRRGETPIPCVRCNQRIKFRDLLDTARDLGASALATGHYVRRIEGPDGPELHRAWDASRDQSYFLFATTRAELDFLRFPLGGLTKDETRVLARQFGLPVADKPDSQDICFVPQGSYARLVTRLRPEAGEPGTSSIAEAACSADITASHAFTVGQSKGLGIASADPLYVLRIDAEQRRVVVGPRAALAGDAIAAWRAKLARPVGARGYCSSRQAPLGAIAGAGDALSRQHRGRGHIGYGVPAGAVAPGQAAVLYDGERVLGGGWIRRWATAAA